MKYSVVVPVYNAENTLRRCVDSIMNQNFTDMQLILINDGSPDNSGKICEEYAKKYDNVLYIEQENSGVSATRNKGMDIAEGEYILFVDSDDYVSDDYFEVIDNAVSAHNPDVFIFSMAYTDGNREKICPKIYSTDKITTANKFYELSNNSMMNSMLNKVYRRSIIEENKIRLNPNLPIGEDVVYAYTYSLYVTVLETTDKCLYIVDEDNTDSLSRKRRDSLADSMYELNVDMCNALDKAPLDKKVRKIYAQTVIRGVYFGAYSSCRELLKYDYTAKQRRKKIREICKRFCSRGLKPDCLRTWIIALPVRLKSGFIIDFMIKHR